MSEQWNWQKLSPEEKKQFIADSVEAGHKQQYEATLAWAERPGPLWEDLTEEQRIFIRNENRRYANEMFELGRSLGK